MLHIRPGQPPALWARPQPVGTRRGDPDRRHRQPHVRVSQREVQQGLRLGKLESVDTNLMSQAVNS